MLKWPDRARSAIRKLFEPLQDIDVYVEDTHDEAFYRCLLNSATKNNDVKVARVFALGGRQPVIDAAMIHDQKTRRALFIIDGDISWVKGEAIPSMVGLHCHDAYCVENLLLCEKALTLLLSQDTAITEDKAAERLAYVEWIQSIELHLIELFSAFATVHYFDQTVKTVAQGVGVMCIKHRSTGTTELDPSKVRAAKDQALKSAEKVATADAISEVYDRMLNRIKDLHNPLHAVSGKDFLIPLLDFHLQSFGCRIKRKALRIRLASAGDPMRFEALTDALNRAARGYA
ncbi:MAG TPA: hypothetical protein DCY86_10900 [Bdellovibrionales bacterium]|nr:hypothetical protein [Bdellovibrionales bacterium]